MGKMPWSFCRLLCLCPLASLRLHFLFVRWPWSPFPFPPLRPPVSQSFPVYIRIQNDTQQNEDSHPTTCYNRNVTIHLMVKTTCIFSFCFFYYSDTLWTHSAPLQFNSGFTYQHFFILAHNKDMPSLFFNPIISLLFARIKDFSTSAD